MAFLSVETIGDSRSRSGLVNDTETRDRSAVHGGLVVRVDGNGDDGQSDGPAEVQLGDLLHLRQNCRRDLGG